MSQRESGVMVARPGTEGGVESKCLSPSHLQLVLAAEGLVSGLIGWLGPVPAAVVLYSSAVGSTLQPVDPLARSPGGVLPRYVLRVKCALPAIARRSICGTKVSAVVKDERQAEKAKLPRSSSYRRHRSPKREIEEWARDQR